MDAIHDIFLKIQIFYKEVKQFFTFHFILLSKYEEA